MLTCDLAIVLCLIFPFVVETKAEVYLVVRQTSNDGSGNSLNVSCYSRNHEDVDLMYKFRDNSTYTVIQTKTLSERMNEHYFAMFGSVNDTGYYRCSTVKEHSLTVFLRVDEESKDGVDHFLNCWAHVQSNVLATSLTCISGNLSSEKPFRLKDRPLNCDATKEGSASCSLSLPLQGIMDSSRNSIEVRVSPTAYSYSFVCQSLGRHFETVESNDSTVAWRVRPHGESAHKSTHFEMNCTVWSVFGQVDIVRFEIVDYSVAFWCLVVYAGISVCVFLFMLVVFCRKQHRIKKMRHIYATFNASLSESSDTPQRDLSRRPTRSLPPIPTGKSSSEEIHYANAHLRLSQNSMPARLRHSMFSFSSDVMEAQLNNRNSLPLHASNVSAQNALYFFTDPADDVSQKETTPKSGQAFTFPFTLGKSLLSSSSGGNKCHTMNHRSSSLLGKRRNSDYQNWFQQYKLSTSCPTIDAIEEGKEGEEPTDQLKSLVKIRHKSDRYKRRSLIRNRLSSVCKEHTLPRRKLSSLSRPLSEYMMQPENPYVDRSNVTSCYSK